MNQDEIATLFASFRRGYDAEAKDVLWQQQSKAFRDFWTSRVMGSGPRELSDAEIDEIVRILDSSGKGNTKASEAVARAMIPQGAWRRMFNQIRQNSELAGILNEIFLEQDRAKRAASIDHLYRVNEKNKNNLTGRSGNAIGVMLAAWDPKANLSVISLNDRRRVLDFFQSADFSRRYHREPNCSYQRSDHREPQDHRDQRFSSYDLCIPLLPGGQAALETGRGHRAGRGGAAIRRGPQTRNLGQQGPSCYDRNKFSALLGGGSASRVVGAVETGSAISLASDVIAFGLKGTRKGIGGTTNPYASGFNMVGRAVVQTGGRALGLSTKAIGRGVGLVNSVGNKVTPVLAIIAAFTLAYNTTIDVQCRLGTLE